MTALVGSSQAASIRASLAVFLTHTAEIRTATGGAEDPHGDATAMLGAPVTVACKYGPNDRVRIDEGGTVLVQRPTLKVAASTALAAGDLIQNIRNSDGVVLAAGPFTVGQCLSSDGFGVALSRRFELRGADPVRGS